MAAGCSVTQADVRVVCSSSAEGMGAGHKLLLTVAGQQSAASTATLSYAPPAVSGFTPNAPFTTRGGTQLVLQGTNFGPQVIRARHCWLPGLNHAGFCLFRSDRLERAVGLVWQLLHPELPGHDAAHANHLHSESLTTFSKCSAHFDSPSFGSDPSWLRRGPPVDGDGGRATRAGLDRYDQLSRSQHRPDHGRPVDANRGRRACDDHGRRFFCQRAWSQRVCALRRQCVLLFRVQLHHHHRPQHRGGPLLATFLRLVRAPASMCGSLVLVVQCVTQPGVGQTFSWVLTVGELPCCVRVCAQFIELGAQPGSRATRAPRPLPTLLPPSLAWCSRLARWAREEANS